MRSLVMALMLVGSVGGLACGGEPPRTADADDPRRVAREFGMPGKAWRFVPESGAIPGLKLATTDRGDGTPCIARQGVSGGGSCFFAVNDGGWALEATLREEAEGTVILGAAVPATHRIRVGRFGSIRTEPVSDRFDVRFFAARVPDGAWTVPPNHIVALDAQGRLLGRQHYNDGHGGFRARDGRWERAFDRRAARTRERAGSG